MSAVEEIQAAIEKLTEQKDQSTSGPWWAWHPANGRGNSSVDAPSGDPDNPEMPVEGQRVDVDLIVTLHATIDAQLAILGYGLAVHGSKYSDLTPPVEHYALTLARAISGANS